MSLLCDETGRDIEFGEELSAGTRCNEKFFSALCKEVIDRIPASERRCQCCKPENGGVDIHGATSTFNPEGNYTVYDFTLGTFKFSISQEAAEKYLPNHIKRYGFFKGCRAGTETVEKRRPWSRYQILKENCSKK